MIEFALLVTMLAGKDFQEFWQATKENEELLAIAAPRDKPRLSAAASSTVLLTGAPISQQHPQVSAIHERVLV